MVLGSRSEKGDSSDINLLDRSGEGAVGLLGLQDERVQVADDEGDRVDRVGGEVGEVGWNVPGEDTSVNGRVEGLDPSAEHLGSLGDGRDISEPVNIVHLRENRTLDRSVPQNPLNLQTSLADQLCGSPGTKQPEPKLLERGRKGEQVGLVVHREESWG